MSSSDQATSPPEPRGELPTSVLERVIAQWRPEEIWLYGSRAHGTHRPDSDWDLLVIVPDNTPASQLDLGEAWAALSDLRPPVEAYPVLRSEFEEGQRHLGSLARIAVTEGRRIYAR
ncbi:MAG: nucleotidyltransferase domain-containing protein [Deltaproteobacteria bacterium]|nr:nucleotidyltransferase domain-containing protein [Deltaproteobacteria bacterium]